MLQERQANKQRNGLRFNIPPGLVAVESKVRGRTILLGCVLTALVAKLVTQAELVMSPPIHIGYLQFPPAALALLLVAICLSRGLGLISKKLALSGSDLLIIYCMLLVATMVSSHGVIQKLIPLLGAPNYFANSTNNWHKLYDPHYTSSMMAYDPRIAGQQPVTTGFWNGLHHGESIPWTPWIAPLLRWGTLILMVLFSFLCLASILRKQWVDSEKLAFPLSQLPLELTAENGAFFRNPVMWMGTAVPVILFGLKGLHQLAPSVPDVMTPVSINDWITTPPWNGLGMMPLTISFAAVGFFFLLPADVLFSIWFFFALTRVEELAAIAYNFPTPGMPMYPPKLFTGYQSMGAYFVLVGYLFWIARPHLRRVWAAAIGREKADDADEVIPYRFAVWGMVGAFVASCLWLSAMGMSLWLAVLELGVFIFVIAVVMARSTAEAGLLMTETTFRPIDIYRMFGSIHALGPTNIAMLAMVDNLLLRDQRGLLLTGMLDAMRIADGTRIRRRAFAGILSFGVLLSIGIAIYINLTTSYQLGANRLDPWMGTYSPQLSFQDYANYFNPNFTQDPTMRWQMPAFFVVGVVVSLFLTMMRTAFHWWPLHPLGYALAGSWTTVVFWFPCLVAWICKSLSLRYGGMSFYTKARPFFLGLVLGEFSMAVFYAVLNLFWKINVPFPWS